MPQLDFSYYIAQFAWSIFGFSFLYIISSKYIMKYITFIVNARSNLINGNLDFAKELLKKTDLIKKKISQKETETKLIIEAMQKEMHDAILVFKNEKNVNLQKFIDEEMAKSQNTINLYFQANEQDIKQEFYVIIDRLTELMEIENRKEAIEYISQRVNSNIDYKNLNLFN